MANKKEKGESDLEFKDIYYNNYYHWNKHKNIIKVSPKKSSDLIKDYYLVFDNFENLYQIFTVVSYKHINATKKEDFSIINANSASNKSSFENMKKYISDIYGNSVVDSSKKYH